VERGNDACHAKAGPKGGVALHRAGAKGEKPKAPPKPKPAPDPAKVAKAQEIMRDAAQYMQEGRFEKARGRFEEAIAIVPLPEAYNGIGVTHAARDEWKDALAAYKQAVDLEPNFGDSYYNMACAYSRQNKKDAALKYLKLSLANGYGTERDAMDDDHDLDPLRDDARFQKLMKDAQKGVKAK
jgi:tetratricopeptide (TPR) repeat protein